METDEAQDMTQMSGEVNIKLWGYIKTEQHE